MTLPGWRATKLTCDRRSAGSEGQGVEAIAAFERYRPDVTLLDLRMPVRRTSAISSRSLA
jgi:CheY-like chemotaxis protein